ncbi:TonB family protein [Lutimaribacter sp. EGI FJ00015]|uniref:TonB family protein n=1 Tax=Lutimaribacter degradans TaxID=2945989 RepID=A0ACC5ZYM1_9RHOB|nr:TonB family protein [Lutimaribacter sp. EGI FJ00013]MCM2563176.1 TonB family protein [Lutimaribacter sp. EGI FJ00013]MCO0614355.1 TonB family protein [Lutimaribacter sp. EGI FJ00015]MCO0637165.1 TonB family protein [Lutimaribacter sp. EGI FJ00014]
MIGSNPVAKFGALGLALAAHGVLALAWVAPAPVEIEGGGGASEVRLGSAFQDMAAGTLAPMPPEKIAAARPDKQSAESAPQRLTAQPARTAANPSPPNVLSAAPAQRAVVPTEPVDRAPRAPQTSPEAIKPAPADADASVRKAGQPEALQGTEPDSAAVARSLRPKPRSATFERTHRTAPEPRPQAKPRPTQRGNASRNARAGTESGQAQAKAAQSGSDGQEQASGNAAASNYPGQVMRALSRAGKPRVNARGSAVVAFTIAPNGRLASVSLARSSGSSALDQAALRLVRGAGPFPSPPVGAQRSFSIQIKGR